jgi:PAS domain S-box-containing protein
MSSRLSPALVLPFSDRALAVLLAQISDGVVLADRDGRFVYVNDVASRIFADCAEEAGSAGASERLASGTGGAPPAWIDGAIARTLLTGEHVRDEDISSRSRTGEERWLRVSASPVRGASGAIESAIVTVTDVTAQKSAEAFAPIMRSLARL